MEIGKTRFEVSTYIMKIRDRVRKTAFGLCAGILAGVLWGGGSSSAYGADSSVIENVSVALKAAYGEPEEILEPAITVSGSGCSLGEVVYRTDPERWKPGQKVRVEITVQADAGKVFPVSLNRSQCKVSGADYVSARAEGDDKLVVKADFKPVMVLGSTAWAGWSSADNTKAVWQSVDYAPGYSVVVYGDSKSVKKLTVKGTSADLGQYMKDADKTYSYEVKAIPTTSDEKKYLKDGVFVASIDEDDTQFKWNGNTDVGGSIKNGNYVLPDGRKDVNTWKKVSEKWYYFDGNGNMAKGWHFINGFWYYMNQNGIMQTGWINPYGDTWFYSNSSGQMQTGWIQPVPGQWFYLDGSGYMQRGWSLINGKWYYLGEDGRMRTGWINPGGTWYFLYNDGSMAAGTVLDGWTIGANGAAYQ